MVSKIILVCLLAASFATSSFAGGHRKDDPCGQKFTNIQFPEVREIMVGQSLEVTINVPNSKRIPTLYLEYGAQMVPLEMRQVGKDECWTILKAIAKPSRPGPYALVLVDIQEFVTEKLFRAK